MGKILIIKNADFSANAVDVVTPAVWVTLTTSIITNEGGVNSTTGVPVGSASAKYGHTDYVNITAYKGGKLKYKNVGGLNSNSENGMAFYDNNKTYISGVNGLKDNSIYTETVVDIPANAAYVIFTCWLPSLGYDDFAASAHA